MIGFFLATIIYSFVLMYLGHYRRLFHVTLLSVAIAFAFMFMFMRVVYVALPARHSSVRRPVLCAPWPRWASTRRLLWSSSISRTALCRCFSRSTS